MISISNRGFWSFGRQQEPVASFTELPRPKELVAFPPRLLSGSKTPVGRAGTATSESIMRRRPTNELGKTVATTGALEKPRKHYNKGKLAARLTPGVSIPAPVPWSFEAVSKRLDGIDSKDTLVEDVMKEPLSDDGYAAMLKTFIKTEFRDVALRQLKSLQEQLGRLTSAREILERQGRLPSPASENALASLRDEIDRWVVANAKFDPGVKRVPPASGIAAASSAGSSASSVGLIPAYDDVRILDPGFKVQDIITEVTNIGRQGKGKQKKQALADFRTKYRLNTPLTSSQSGYDSTQVAKAMVKEIKTLAKQRKILQGKKS